MRRAVCRVGDAGGNDETMHGWIKQDTAAHTVGLREMGEQRYVERSLQGNSIIHPPLHVVGLVSSLLVFVLLPGVSWWLHVALKECLLMPSLVCLELAR